jgi:vancomycin resistance protein YoaR
MRKRLAHPKFSFSPCRKYLLFFLVFIFLLPLVALASYHLAFWGRIYPGVTVSGVAIGNLTQSEAAELLTSYFSRNPLSTLTLTYRTESWVLPLLEMGIYPDTQLTAARAFSVGRVGLTQKSFLEKWVSFWKGISVPVDYKIPPGRLEEKISSIAIGINKPAVDPALVVAESYSEGVTNRISYSPGVPGRFLDTEQLKKQILVHLTNNDPSPIVLPIKTLSVSATIDDLELARKRAEILLDKSIILEASDYSFEVRGKALVTLVDFHGGYDREKLQDYIKNAAHGFDREPENAAFSFENGRVTVFKPAREGISIKQEAALTGLTQELSALEATSSIKLKYNLPTMTIKPAITTESVNTLGIKELLGIGRSTFKGSIASRIHNITLASLRLNGVLISPGEVFSFNRALGDVSAATGYQQAYIIKEGRTVLGDGGGVCQVSTTLFRAALNAGLPIEERWAHAYRVSYYEQDSGPGLDATVYDPTNDLKIKNDTPAHILIQSRMDTNKLSLTFELYGTNDGRKAEISKPRVWDETPPPPDLYQDDPTLPAGQVKQVDWKAWGAKVSFDYKITRNDEVLIEKTFYSNFKPWQAIFLKGTKT